MTPFNLSTITKGTTTKTYQALQFHFHHRSEHLFDHRHYDLELHVVHQAEDRSLAVYGMLFQVKYYRHFEDPFNSWNLDTDTAVEQEFPLPLTTPKGIFHYKGSLTTRLYRRRPVVCQ